MTISVAWVRRNKGTIELLVASDSRLRSRGAIDQAQKLFPLARGDCCLSFAGDTQISYPLFIQIGTTLNHHIKTRTRAKDVTQLTDHLKQIINAYVTSWDLPNAEKADELANTKLLFGGWSWRNNCFYTGVFRFVGTRAVYGSQPFRIGHPWQEKIPSMTFVGDYESEYRAALVEVLERRVGIPTRKERRAIDLNYEPVEALQSILSSAPSKGLTAIGGAPQFVKVYPFANCLPFIVRTPERESFLLGRKLLAWEKSELPILDLSKFTARTLYPMAHIPRPDEVDKSNDVSG